MCNANIRSALKLFESEFTLAEVKDGGANGYVLVGTHKILQRPAVIKIYGCGEQDIREPSLIAACAHENIVQVFQARRDEEMDNMCYFMEPCDSDLTEVTIFSGHKMSSMLSYMMGILAGLSYLHTKPTPIIHGDIKPGNVLLKDGIAKLCDFGSAAILHSDANRVPAGTILSKPPEALSANPQYDVRSDVYQAGVRGYCLFGGILSNDLESYLTKKERVALRVLPQGYEQSAFVDHAITRQIVAGQLLKWRSLPSFLSNRISRILRKATELNPLNRYASAADMMVDINNANDYLDWQIMSENERILNYRGEEYRLAKDGVHWCAFTATAPNVWRRKLCTKAKAFDECLKKLRVVIRADRDA